MADESKIINPFKQVNKTNWAQKSQNKFKQSHKIEDRKKHLESHFKKKKKVASKNVSSSYKVKTLKKEEKVKRVSKSFKVIPNKVIRDFEKRVHKLQVIGDDLNLGEDFVDQGKYLMFLMAFAEKYEIYDIYSKMSSSGEFEIDKHKLKHFAKKLK